MRMRMLEMINVKKEEIIKKREEEFLEEQDMIKKFKDKCKKGEESIAVLGDPAIKESIEQVDENTSQFLNKVLSNVH